VNLIVKCSQNSTGCPFPF